MKGQDYNISSWSIGPEGFHVGMVVETTIFSSDLTISGHHAQENKRQWRYQNEAEVMYITPVTMDHPHSSYLEKNMSLKIMVHELKWHDLQN